jgi:hypothetical protein
MPNGMILHRGELTFQKSGVFPAFFWHARCESTGGTGLVAPEYQGTRLVLLHA